MLLNSILVFVTVLCCLLLVEGPIIKLFIIASVRSIYGVFRGVVFLPIYGAKCLGLRWTFFYKDLTKPIGGLLVVVMIMFGLRLLYIPTTWLGFFCVSFVTAVLSLIVGSFVILNKNDIKFISQKIYDKHKK